MRIERHPYWFSVRSAFPNARAFRHWDTCRAYKAERDQKPFLILDDGTIADFLDEGDPMLNECVSVIEFDNEAEREAYIAREIPGVPPALDPEREPFFFRE